MPNEGGTDALRNRRKREGGESWLATLLGVFVLVCGGFAVGLVAGVISEEPELVVGHVTGRSSEVDWSSDGAGGAATDAVDVAAAPVGAPRRIAAPAPSAQPDSSGGQNTGSAAVSKAPHDDGTRRGTGAAARPRSASAEERAGDEGDLGEADARFAVQVGAFGSAQSAERIAGRLRTAGYPVRIVSPSSDDRWRVRVGPIGSRAQAEQTAGRLKVEENLPTWVLREDGS